MSYKNAFKCHKCPEDNSAKGCPMWWEISETEELTGQTRIRKACGYVLMPTYFQMMIRASNRPAAAENSTRNELSRKMGEGFDKIAQVLQNMPKTIELRG